MAMILVLGATGYLGGRLIPRLLAGGHEVRCFVRDASRIGGRGWTGVETVVGDVLRPDTLTAAMKGIDVAYYLVHSMAAGERDFADRDRIGAENFSRAAAQAGIRRIIYLGGLGSETEKLSAHLRSRQETGRILRSSGIPTTEFRAGVIVGSGSLSFEIIRYLTERVPVMICPRWVSTLAQPIAVRDVLRYLVDCLDVPESAGTILEIGGADVLSYGDMMLRYARVRGLRRWMIHVPVLTPRLSSYWIDFVTPVPSAIARPLIEGLRNEVICHDTTARNLFSFEPIGYDEAVRFALQSIGSRSVETMWYDAQSSTVRAAGDVVVLREREGMIRETRETTVNASAENLFRVITAVGGDNGWPYANMLWRIRGFLDRLAGGVGFRRGRRSQTELRPGDALDFWRVEIIEPERLLRLRAEMKLPGRAWLQFQIVPLGDDRVRLTQTAFFEPRGLAGQMYWSLLYPFHRIIFGGMIRTLGRRAEMIQREQRT